jgi:hypothetical protein
MPLICLDKCSYVCFSTPCRVPLLILRHESFAKKEMDGPGQDGPGPGDRAMKKKGRSVDECAAQMKPEKPSKCRKESKQAVIQEEFGVPDAETVLLVKGMLNLSEEEAQVLGNVLSKLQDDPLLVLKFNPNWIPDGGANADAILDAIAVFEMPVAPPGAPQTRRDDQVGCNRWIFQFKSSSDMIRCRNSIQALHINAFAFTPTAAAKIAARYPLGPPLPAQDTQPLAETVVITKFVVTSSDTMEFPFFYA